MTSAALVPAGLSPGAPAFLRHGLITPAAPTRAVPHGFVARAVFCGIEPELLDAVEGIEEVEIIRAPAEPAALAAALAEAGEVDVIGVGATGAPEELARLAAVVRAHPPEHAVLFVGHGAEETFPDAASLPYDIWLAYASDQPAELLSRMLRSVREREALLALEAFRNLGGALDEILTVDLALGDAAAAAMLILSRTVGCLGAAFWRPTASGTSLVEVGAIGPRGPLARAAAGGPRPRTRPRGAGELPVAGTIAGEVLTSGTPHVDAAEGSLIIPVSAHGRVTGVIVLAGAAAVARRRSSFELAEMVGQRIGALVSWHLTDQRFTAYTANSASAIVLTDRVGRIVVYNRAAGEMFGVPREDALEQRLEVLLAPSCWREFASLTELAADARENDEPAPFELELETARAGVRHVEGTVASWGTGADRRFALTIRDVSEQRRAEERIRQLAYTDPSTGLPNHAALVEDPREGGALVVLQSRRYERVVRSLGEVVSGAVLRAIGERLQAVTGPGVSLYHLEHERFALWAGDTSRSGLEALVARTQAAMREPLEVADMQLRLPVDCGVAVVEPGESGLQLALDGARRALSAAAEADDERPRFHDPAGPDDRDRLEREAELHVAIVTDQLRLRYQPIVALPGGEVAGFEALVRWEHPERGLLAPGAFVEIAEQSGQVAAMGRWVIEEACRQLAEWRDAGLGELHVSVNVSPRQLLTDELVGVVAGALTAHAIAPGQLTVEVVETAALRDVATAQGTLSRLHALGVTIALDDFGVGESSLGRLGELPVDVLKLDRSLIAGLPGDRASLAVTRSAIELARGLEIDIVCEGIEEVAQRDRVHELGCVRGQGFLFARPLPPGDVPELLAAAGSR